MVRFDPSVGAEIQKLRPAVVMSIPEVGRLPLCIVVPITTWKDEYRRFAWFVQIPPSPDNGLGRESGADAFQIKSLSVNRLVQRLGALTAEQIQSVADAIALCVGHVP